MDSTFYIDNATYPFCWELPLSILWLFSLIHTLMKTMVNNLQFGFHQGWYILVFKVPTQCENCLRIIVHSNNHPTLMGTYYLWIGWMSPIWHMCHIMHQPRYVSSSIFAKTANHLKMGLIIYYMHLTLHFNPSATNPTIFSYSSFF